MTEQLSMFDEMNTPGVQEILELYLELSREENTLSKAARPLTELSNAELIAKVFDVAPTVDQLEKIDALIGTHELSRPLTRLESLTPESIEAAHVKGLTPEKLRAFAALSRRFESRKLTAIESVKGSQEIGRRLVQETRNLDHEEAGALFLDIQNQILSQKVLFKGSLSSSAAEPRDIVREALLLSASAIIVYHNHPGGGLTPSEEDNDFTQRLMAAGSLLGVQVIDHLVLGSDDYFSYAEKGRMANYRAALGIRAAPGALLSRAVSESEATYETQQGSEEANESERRSEMDTTAFNDWLEQHTITYYEPIEKSLPFDLESLNINQLGYLKAKQAEQITHTLEGMQQEVAKGNWADMRYWQRDMGNNITNITKIDAQFQKVKLRNEREYHAEQQANKQARHSAPRL